MPRQLGPAERGRIDELLLQDDASVVFCRSHYWSGRHAIKWLWHYPGRRLKKLPIQSTWLQVNGILQSKSGFASFLQLLEFSKVMCVWFVITCLELTDIPESLKSEVARGKRR